MSKIAIGCDHIVTPIKNKLKSMLEEQGHQLVDMGTYDDVRTHYPIFGKKVADAVVANEVDFGIVICGTGVGITNAAQKVKGARVALVRDLQGARTAREQLDANIIGFGGNISGIGLMNEVVEIFMNTEFKGNKEVVEYLDSMTTEDTTPADELFKPELIKWDNGEYHD